MDLNQLQDLDKGKGVAMVIRHPDGSELFNDSGRPMTIYLHGKDSNQFKTASKDIEKRYKQKLEVLEGDELVDCLKKIQIELMAMCTNRFSNIQLDGKALKYTRESAEKFYSKYHWIAEQADKFIVNKANFLGKPAKS